MVTPMKMTTQYIIENCILENRVSDNISQWYYMRYNNKKVH